MKKKLHECPCQSSQHFKNCCEPLLKFQKNAKTATELMRSRYSAYATQNVEYLIATWHPQTLPKKLDEEIADAKWIDLKIIKETADPNQSNQAFVEFIATYRDKNGKAHKLHEISRFIKQNEHWFYIDGRFK